MSCGGCQRVRGWLPESIRARLAEVERRMQAKKQSAIVLTYTTTTPPDLAASPQQLPAIPQGGDGEEEARS